MPLSLRLVAALALAFAAGVGRADDPNVAALVKQLGADSFDEREAAAKALVKIGPSAVAALEAALASKDAEVRRRAKKLLTAIELDLYGERHCFESPLTQVMGVAFSPDGKRAIQSDSRGLRLWDLATKKKIAENERHGDRVMRAAFSPDGKTIASCSEDRTVRLFSADALKELHVLRGGHTKAVRGVAFTAKGDRVVSAGMEGSLIEWDAKTGERGKRRMTGRALLGLALAGERMWTASLGSENVEGYPWAGEPEKLAGEKQVSAVAVSADGKRAAGAGRSGETYVWDTATGKTLAVLRGHADAVTSVAMTPDGSRVVTGGFDKTVRLWNADTGREVRLLGEHKGPVWAVAVSADGKRALSGANDGTLKYWAIGR